LASGLSGNLLLVGRVLRPHGLDGLLRVRSYARSLSSFGEVSEVFLRPVSRGIRAHKISSANPHKNIVLMKFEGVNSLEEAEKFREAEVWVSAEAIPREEGEYFWHELIGLKVFHNRGAYIGDISRIIPAGDNEIYVVGRGKGEIFVPATYEVVKEIDLEKGTMTISPMEGLLDLNEV